MAKEFAKQFYHSKAWKLCRESYIAQRIAIDGGICEMCNEEVGEELHHIKEITINNINDPDVTLNHDNLLWVCKDCHFKHHKEKIIKAFENKKTQKILTDTGVWFDDTGVPRLQQVNIVYGSPASGKTTYVYKHKLDGDLVIDLDLIKQAISMSGKTEAPSNLLNVALRCRDVIYSMVESKEVDCKQVWIIGSMPKKKEREELANRLKATLIYIETDYQECVRRAKNDGNRKDKVIQEYIIEKWFEQYQP